MGQLLLRVGVVVVVLLAGIALPVASAQACSCAVLSPKQQLSNADAVFMGTVVDEVRRGTGPADSPVLGDGTVVYTVEVDRVYKGSVPSVQRVTTNDNSASCGISLPASETAVVFGSEAGLTGADLENGLLSTGLCSGSGRATSAPAGLGPGKPPLGEIEPITQPADDLADPAPDWTVLGVIAATLVLLGGLVLLLGTLRRRSDRTTPR